MRVRCDGAKCYVTEVETLASGAINYFTAKFTFDSAWADFITANQLYGVFNGSDTVIISRLIYNSETQTYDCEVPWQTITRGGELLVGTIGHISTPEVQILTTNMAFAYRVPNGAATVGNNLSDPSGLLLDILNAVEDTQENVNKANTAISHWPIIDPTTQNWFRWNTITEEYVDTGVNAQGKDFTILGHYDTYSLLENEITQPKIGDIYSVGTTTPYSGYVYDGNTSTWLNYGLIFAQGSGGSAELTTQPAVNCTSIGIVSVEGYNNTAGYLGFFYETPAGISNTIAPTGNSNEFIITFPGNTYAEERLFSSIAINIPIDISVLPSYNSLEGTVVSFNTQTITVQLIGEISPEDNMLADIFLSTQPGDSYSHVEGINNIVSSIASHAEGSDNMISAACGHIEGCNNIIPETGYTSHAEGYYTTASGSKSHSEGSETIASGAMSHAEGCNAKSSGYASHAEGFFSNASGYCSHASGVDTIANGYAQTTLGKMNIPDETSLFIIGNGTGGRKEDIIRSNALTVDNMGNLFISGINTTTQFKLSALNTAPISAIDTGTLGEIRVTSDYIYVCTATDTWKRTSLTTW